ncbi:TRAP transporter substrate-binding protein [Mammaliicoccus sciuri]|uniref:TRAP transporter substrate-binding protein n=1 Tax=Mammaliicoccus sciuri TaxID=1296 RepID=UPI001E2D5AD9|nr:TRAP transporter substrate-binding protein [Mammaliicoccus sciuri]MCD8818725.1 TRAP transporter substrate-binding protein [Mammaliicoccus sciuri]
MKKILLLIVSVFTVLYGCQQSEAQDKDVKTLTLAHNQSTTHPVHKSLEEFKKEVEKKSHGKLKIKIYANGQLGSEREAIEMTQTNAIQFTKVSASALESFSESYSLFSMPYLFESQDSFRSIMKKPEVQNSFFNTTKDNGFVGITYYDAGLRNIYTKDRKIKTNKDLHGLKTRVQPSKTSVQLIKSLGGTPTPMAFGEVYTALQSGVIDAAENNETALTDNKHGEVAKNYYNTEHAIVPDILIMNKDAYNDLTKEEKGWLKSAARSSTEKHEVIWDKAIKEAIKSAKKDMNVKFHDVDKSSFKKAVKPLQEEFKNNKGTEKQYKLIKEAEQNE